MLSIAHSRYTIPLQFLFLIINAIALLFGITYNNATPDLYESNAHHKIGWIATWVMCAQLVVSLVYAYSNHGRYRPGPNYSSVSTHHMINNQELYSPTSEYRWSSDSGQGTICPTNPSEEHLFKREDEDEEEDIGMSSATSGLLQNNIFVKFFSSRIPGLVSSRVLRVLQIVYNVIDRIILPFGFATLATGVVTYSGIFVCILAEH